MESEFIEVGDICEVLSKLIEDEVFSIKVNVTEHAITKSNSTIVFFNIAWANQSSIVTDYEFLVMPSPDIFSEILLYGLKFKLWI